MIVRVFKLVSNKKLFSTNNFFLLFDDFFYLSILLLLYLDAPDAPESVQVTGTTASSASLEWSPPFSDGGSPVTGYFVERKDQYSARWTRVNRVPVTETNMVVGDLKEGLQYQFRVCAENRAGIGRSSDSTKPTVIKDPVGKFHSFSFITYCKLNQFQKKVFNAHISSQKTVHI